MSIEKLKELLQDDAFVKTLNELASLEEVQAALAERGVDMTLEEIRGVFRAQDGELSETDLEKTAGGHFHLSGGGPVVVVVPRRSPWDR